MNSAHSATDAALPKVAAVKFSTKRVTVLKPFTSVTTSSVVMAGYRISKRSVCCSPMISMPAIASRAA